MSAESSMLSGLAVVPGSTAFSNCSQRLGMIWKGPTGDVVFGIAVDAALVGVCDGVEFHQVKVAKRDRRHTILPNFRAVGESVVAEHRSQRRKRGPPKSAAFLGHFARRVRVGTHRAFGNAVRGRVAFRPLLHLIDFQVRLWVGWLQPVRAPGRPHRQPHY